MPQSRKKKPSDSTRIVLEWLAIHPDLAGDIRRNPGACRENVTSFLYPFDRFPNALDALLRLVLDSVDWEQVDTFIRGE